MPTYTFERPDGTEFELMAPTGTESVTRGGEECKRKTVYAINLGGIAKQPGSTAEQVKTGYYKLEQKGWNSRYSKKQIKQAHGF